MRCMRWTTVGAVFVPALLAAQQPAPAPTHDAVVMSFKFFAAYFGRELVAAFDSIPARDYGYRPTPTQRTIGNIAQHLEEANYGLCGRLGTAPHAETANHSLADTAMAKSPKDTLVARLRASLAYCDSALSRLNDEQLGDAVSYGARRRYPRAPSSDS